MQQLAVRETLRERLGRFMRERAALAARDAKSRPPPLTLDQLIAEDERAVAAELAAVDRRIADIDKVLARAAPDSASYEHQEFASERMRLRDLRTEIEHDRQHPIRTDRDGNLLDARQRVIRRERARTLCESSWREAERARAEGDHRAARRHRLDALRARQLAEAELGWRPQISTYW